MITRTQARRAQQRAAEMLSRSGVALTPEEREKMIRAMRERMAEKPTGADAPAPAEGRPSEP